MRINDSNWNVHASSLGAAIKKLLRAEEKKFGKTKKYQLGQPKAHS